MHFCLLPFQRFLCFFFILYVFFLPTYYFFLFLLHLVFSFYLLFILVSLKDLSRSILPRSLHVNILDFTIQKTFKKMNKSYANKHIIFRFSANVALSILKNCIVKLCSTSDCSQKKSL